MADADFMADLFAAVRPEAPPPCATKHCRHYSYNREGDGPTCSQGVDLSGRGASVICMPSGVQFGKTFEPCPWREDYTEEEQANWKEWARKTAIRSIAIMSLIPGSSTKKDDHWGESGKFQCPACGGGLVRWVRSTVNGHLAARCSTPDCFEVME